MADPAFPSRRRLILALIIGLPSLFFLTASIVEPILPDSVSDTVDPVLSATCHRLASRSLELPWGLSGLCSRCTAFWAGMVAGAVLVLFELLRIPLWLAVLLIVPLAVDGALQYMGLYTSLNIIRILTGAAGGIGLAAVFSTSTDGRCRRDTARTEPGGGRPACV